MSFMYQALERNLRMLFTGSSQRPRKHVSSPLASYFLSCPYARLGWWVRVCLAPCACPCRLTDGVSGPCCPSIRHHQRYLGYVVVTLRCLLHVGQDVCANLAELPHPQGWGAQGAARVSVRGDRWPQVWGVTALEGEAQTVVW